jgi:hypothetical protein
MPSGKKQRKAGKDAEKAAKAGAAGASGAAGAAAALANVNVTPLGDWETQTEDATLLCRSLGREGVTQRAAAGDAEAQWSLAGCLPANEHTTDVESPPLPAPPLRVWLNVHSDVKSFSLPISVECLF